MRRVATHPVTSTYWFSLLPSTKTQRKHSCFLEILVEIAHFTYHLKARRITVSAGT
eukprot:UN11074